MKADPIHAAPELAQHTPKSPSRSGQTFSDVLQRAIRRVDERASAANIPATLDAASALRLQASVYNEAERVELVSKLVDHAVGAVKTLLQTRV